MTVVSAPEETMNGEKRITRSILRRILQYLVPYKWKVTISLVFLIAFSGLQLAAPYLIKIAIDGPIASKDVNGLMEISLIYLAVIFGSVICLFGQIYMMTWTGQHIMFDIRNRLFKHIQTLNLKFFDKTPVGTLMTRLTSDIETLNELLSSGIVQIIGDLLTLIGILVILFVLNAQLAAITLIGLVFLVVITLIFRTKFRTSFRLVRTKVAVLNGFLQEAISGIHVVQLFNNHRRQFTKFDQANRDTLDAHLLTVFYFSIFVPFVELANSLVIVMILVYGGLLVPKGIVTIGTLVAFFQYAHRFFRPLRDLSQRFNILQSAMAASEKIFTVLDTHDVIPESQHPETIETVAGKIEFDHLWFAYNDEDWILKDVSFTVNPGETVAIVGATGAGKSTIINLICRFYDPQKGAVRLDGIDIRNLSKSDLRRHIALVHQDAFIFSGSIADNISLDREGFTRNRIEKAIEDSNLEPFIKRMPQGLDQDVGERGARISAGERQLLAFARAVSFNPEILILDEATSNVDTETEVLIQDAITGITENRTSIIIAHRLSTIRSADRILVFHHGKLREEGTHDELVQNGGIYSRLYEVYYSRIG